MENNESGKDKQKLNVTVNLLLKYYHEKTSPEENQLLQQWLDQSEENKLFLEKIINQENLQKELQIFDSLEMNAAWQKVAAKTTKQERTISFWTSPNLLKYAASIGLITLITVVTLLQKDKKTNQFDLVTRRTQLIQQDILPTGNKATLTFADGSFVVLQDLKNGIIKEYNGTRVIKQDEQIIFELNKNTPTDKVGKNLLSTQNGVQYKIVLTDGSKIWLNAASSLSFPTAFTKKERVVELKGEGYFEVAKNKSKPFKVKTNKAMVTVLGTHFNIMAYLNEKTINTTLLEGSVKVITGNRSKLLVPGQQAQVNDNIEISEVDLEETVAWKNGNFQFNNTELGMIMRQIERWYNVKVDYKGKVMDKHFTGVISRNIGITKVLEMLELSGGLNFKMEGRRIIVSPN